MRRYIVLLIVFLCVVSGCQAKPNVLYQKYQYPNEQYFGVEVYSEILYECTEDERNTVTPLMETAEKIFSYTGPKVEKEQAVIDEGELARYYSHKDITTEEHHLELITVKLEEQTGVMWVAYYCKAYDKDGSLAYLSGGEGEMILARWELAQVDGVWTVTSLQEAP